VKPDRYRETEEATRNAGPGAGIPREVREVMKMRYAYTGERCPRFIPVCVYEGYLDNAKYHNLDQLYRPVMDSFGISPRGFRYFKNIGWSIGKVFALVTK
jgi:hypothetical protein